jgi:hypothetical protein
VFTSRWGARAAESPTPPRSGYQCDEEELLAAHGSHPKAAEIRERQHRSFWLRGYYGLLGQAYLTLVPVG